MAGVKSLDWPALGMMGIAIALGIAGQIFIKAGISHQPMHSLLQLARGAIRLPVVIGLLCYVLSTALYLVVLSRLDLSYVYPMVAVGQVGVLFFSWLLFKEAIPGLRVLGMAAICLGVILVALSPAPRHPAAISHTYCVAEK